MLAFVAWLLWPNTPLRTLNRFTSIAIVQNQTAPHIREATEAFAHTLRNRLGPLLQISEFVGSPDSDGDPLNEKAFAQAFKYGEPDLLVTVGTQVSVYAAQHYPSAPRFFLIVTDPIRSGLISNTDIEIRKANVAGYSNGVIRDRLVSVLANCFPGKRLAFLYSRRQSQDVLMRDFLLAQTLIRIIPIEIDASFGNNNSANGFVIESSSRAGFDIAFGWNYLNTNIDAFIRNNIDVAFIGPSRDNIAQGAVASYGANTAEIGKQAANLLADQVFLGPKALGQLSIKYPDTAELLLNGRALQKRGIAVGTNCSAKEVF